MKATQRGLVLALVIVVAGGTAYLSRGGGAPPEPRAAADTTDPAPPGEPIADWCATGYTPIGGGCLALPASRSASPALIVYLHGRYAKDASSEESDRQRRLAVRANERGDAVLALRGRLGACGSAQLSNWYCWPSNDRTVGEASDVVASWRGALSEAARRSGASHRYVLGFSNGGYFASVIAGRRLLGADAYVVAHGGPVEPPAAGKSTPPVLLLSADDDVAQDDMLRLDQELTRSAWPHDAYARAGAHGLTDQDLDAALAFFERAGEPMPLAPPLAGLHRATHHPHAVPGVEPAPPENAALETANEEPAWQRAESPSEETAFP
ncbi:MAG TPA: hypothetical protein VGG39_00465 [Polyangiaceae bacterium]